MSSTYIHWEVMQEFLKESTLCARALLFPKNSPVCLFYNDMLYSIRYT